MIAEIIPDKRTNPEKNTFSYLIPEDLQNQIYVGSIVEISFGKKIIRGVIAKLHTETENLHFDYELKNIISINPNFAISKEYLETARWISEYYLCSLGEAISLFLPPKIVKPRKSEIQIEKRQSNRIINLTVEQEEIFQKLKAKFIDCSNIEKGNDSKPLPCQSNKALLFGVTGSGKTEIYLKLAAEILSSGKQVIVLVPEIMLTTQIVEQFEKTFPDQICLMHSNLSTSERFLAYQDFYSGKKSIIIGPRSALLVPSQNLGLIIIDEEQEDAYKQEKDPRYHAITLAEKIAEKSNAILLLGSATPRIETFYKTDESEKEYELFILKSRYNKLLLPPAKIIDLKDEMKKDNYSPISLELQKKIAETLKLKRQIILFLNRRGMSTFVSCRECGEVINCKNCDIPMVYHVNSGRNILNCHHCNFTMAVPEHCPNCNGVKIKYFGAGIDKIVNEINSMFPKARVKKIDSKSLTNKGEYAKLYDDLKNKKIDILIGTQILAKGLDIPGIDLVGIVSADTGLHMPYFKAEEKVFSLLTQVSGRSGRRDNVGQTIIQSYWPDSFAIKMAANHDYHAFYEKEISERKKYSYPPFCHLVHIISENIKEIVAKKEIEKVAKELKENKIEFIGPAKCFLSKVNNKYRYHLIIKVKKLPEPKITEIFVKNPYLVWDIDPIDLL